MTNILVVENDAGLNGVVCAHLNGKTFHAKGCLNANDAVYNSLFDLIISNIMMPGFEFTEIIWG